jgi:hypothetical protein
MKPPKMTAAEVAAKAYEHGKKSGKITAKWKTTTVGGFELQWDPYGAKTLERYATKAEHDDFVKQGNYASVNYGGSTDKAVWFKTKGGSYDASFAAERPWIVVIEVIINKQTPLINFESEDFEGEAKHPNMVIVKTNEAGAYGIGRGLIDKLRPKWEKNPAAK